MNEAEYQEQGKVKDGSALEPFFKAMLPILRSYGFDWDADDDPWLQIPWPPQDAPLKRIIGDPQGARVKYHAEYYPGCGYDTPINLAILNGIDLVQTLSGQKLEFQISITAEGYGPTTFQMTSRGAADEIEKIRAAIKPVLESCAFKAD